MTTKRQLQANIKRGIKFLDTQEPEWKSKIDCSILDLSEGDYCILGQVFVGHMTEYITGYHYALEEKLQGFVPNAEKLGFYSYDDDDWDKLTELWKKELCKE